MSDDQREGIIQPPPNRLPRPLKEQKDALSLDDAVKRAEARMADLVESEPNWADADMECVTKALIGAENDKENSGSHMAALYAGTHELKGMGGNFGYPIVTDIASLLCKYLQDQEEPDMRVITLHVDSLKLVFDHNLGGDGGEEGRILVERLAKLEDKAAMGKSKLSEESS
jgi:hypothetical protein